MALPATLLLLLLWTGTHAIPEKSRTLKGAPASHNHEDLPRKLCSEAHAVLQPMAGMGARKEWQRFDDPRSVQELQQKWKAHVESLPRYEDAQAARGVAGRGIVVTGGVRTFPNMLVGLRVLRELGCELPVEVWHFPGEVSEYHARLLRDVGAELRDISAADNFVNATAVPKWTYPVSTAVKVAAILNSGFEEVLSLDADNLLLADPSYLFERAEYTDTGALFWGDFWHTEPRNPLYAIFDTPCYLEREFESGQLLVNKRAGWAALNLAWWINVRHADFGSMAFGDKDTFRFAWKALRAPYHFVQHGIAVVGFMGVPAQAPTSRPAPSFCGHTMGQHDPDGRLLFLHANMLKRMRLGRRGDTRFDALRPWTHVQYDASDPVGVVWALKTPKLANPSGDLTCLKYKPRGGASGTLEARPWGEAVPHAGEWYAAYEAAEGPILYATLLY